MRRILTYLLIPAFALLMSGCETTPWVRGSITEGMPQHTDKFPRDAAFFVEKTERRVKKSFEDAIKERGFAIAEKAAECDYIVRVSVDSWEYNDVGFGGRSGARDHMELSVSLIDRRKKRIIERSRISVRSDFRIISKYVEGL